MAVNVITYLNVQVYIYMYIYSTFSIYVQHNREKCTASLKDIKTSASLIAVGKFLFFIFLKREHTEKRLCYLQLCATCYLHPSCYLQLMTSHHF